MSITPFEELCFEEFQFSKPVKGNGYYYMTVTQHSDVPSPIFMQTPRVNLLSNISNANFVELKLTNEEYKQEIQHIDDKLLGMLKDNKEKWFEGKGLTDQFVDTGYLPSLKRNGDWRVSVSDQIAAYDDNKNTIDVKELCIGDNARCIVQLMGLWFTNTRWGVSWKIIQLKQSKKKEIKKEYMFPDDGEHDTHDVIEPPPGMDE
jgi:hypothetical protein